MVSMEQTMNLCRSKNKNSRIIEIIFHKNKNKTYLILCDRERISRDCVQAKCPYNKIGQ